MEITITKKYLIFPVNTNARNKLVSFSIDHKPMYEFNIKLDNYAPDFYAYIDVARFRGKTLCLSVKPEMELEYKQSDEMNLQNLYRESLRPQVHFTAKNGWINDPNGLIYLDGIYHMFYQYNPAGNHWDNMHWGHAVSKDLIHWEEHDIALFLGENGNIFSGSAVIDENNVLGLAEDSSPAVLLYYTVTGPPFSQWISYSTDHFKTIHEYGNNPVVPHMVGANRDPNVRFCEELNAYVMALFLIDNDYALLSSTDLAKWELIQKIKLQGEAECPDLFFLRDKNGCKKWILMGGSDKYVVGEFKDGKFMEVQEVMSLQYGTGAYAGQSFSNMPKERIVRVCWDRWDHPSTSFTGQMGIPMEMTLEEDSDKYYLCANPVKELEGTYSKQDTFEKIIVSPRAEQCISLEDKPYLVKLKGAYEESVILNFKIFGCDFQVDFSGNQLVLGKTKMPVSVHRDNFDLILIADRHSLEIFADGGKAYTAATEEYGICDRNLPWLSVSATGKYCIETMTLCAMNSIWGE